jgi:hypothetical protein
MLRLVSVLIPNLHRQMPSQLSWHTIGIQNSKRARQNKTDRFRMSRLVYNSCFETIKLPKVQIGIKYCRKCSSEKKLKFLGVNEESRRKSQRYHRGY